MKMLNILASIATPIVDMSDWHNVLTLIFLIIILAFFLFLVFKFIKRVAVYIYTGVFSFLTLLGFILNLYLLTLISIVLLAAGLILVFMINISSIRSYIANPLKNNKRLLINSRKNKVEKIFDREALYRTIDDAVQYLSKHKIGALITFERHTPLSDVMRSGTVVEAPVTMELLVTIFYPGTRLHDGAVVIHGDKIVAASVYFTPTTKPLTGKYGSRHRAAIGISEISDAVTVVVSEETGRISIAYGGELESVQLDNFQRVFITYMEENEEEENDA